MLNPDGPDQRAGSRHGRSGAEPKLISNYPQDLEGLATLVPIDSNNRVRWAALLVLQAINSLL